MTAYPSDPKELTSLGMGSRTFHPFPRLPKELRDAIWAFAIRPNPERPGAHFFTVFDSSNEDEWSLLSQCSLEHPLVDRCSLAAPQQSSWVQGNRSAYMIDSGLWRACTESRDAMERRFKVAHWDRIRCTMRIPAEPKDLPDAPATALFTSGGELQRCLTYPKTDLFLLRPFNGETVDWEYLWSPVPFFDLAHNFYVGHIAIEYDPGWLGDADSAMDSEVSWASPGTIGCAIRAATDQLDWAENLWFVDYRIRPSPVSGNTPPTTTSRYHFHGSGCKFTEVRPDDMGWELDHTRPGDVFRFLEELEEKVGEYFDDTGGYTPGWRPPVPSYGKTPNIGVLAYEESGPPC
jgi:hypothetical protein